MPTKKQMPKNSYNAIHCLLCKKKTIQTKQKQNKLKKWWKIEKSKGKSKVKESPIKSIASVENEESDADAVDDCCSGLNDNNELCESWEVRYGCEVCIKGKQK